MTGKTKFVWLKKELIAENVHEGETYRSRESDKFRKEYTLEELKDPIRPNQSTTTL